ncbi:MFS transporter [Burkholderia gladioli]|uniref:MFS transporter n=1 Tax=Burkholderia gladioli TaxID=28095 RepID=UPI001FC897CC|nr:MFS transporter [Burkholderia gladioli]
MNTTDHGDSLAQGIDSARFASGEHLVHAGGRLNEIYHRITWRLMPILLVAQVLAYLDRLNVGYAKLQMAGQLGLSETVYGLGAGLFFIGYFVFEVPSNLMLHRVGARIWIARIMVTWGIASAAAALVHSETTFYLQRLLLGMAEAGFFPGIVLYLTYWFPAHRRGRTTTLFMSATAVAGIFGNVLSGWIMVHFDGVGTLAGWRWTFIVEGVPSILAGFAIHAWLPNGPAHARWLAPDEVQAVHDDLASPEPGAPGKQAPASRLRAHEIALLSTIYFLLLTGLYGIGFWLPTVVRGTGLADLSRIGLYGAVPYIVAVVAMNLCARQADRRAAWPTYVTGGALVSCVGFAAIGLCNGDLMFVMTGASLACAGTLTALPLFWHLPTARLAGASAAAGIAVINSLGNLSGFVTPLAFGWLKERLHDVTAGVSILAISALLAALLTLVYLALAKRAYH